ncbi:hypothetical protein PT974_01725 [Cladobotryum mycophilum]|uniref:N-acetyltransferase domain-containing protein n=1 Tax=Cladobotryum mycophilum TaxID=491253 RepID=A0ABR0SX85_9HYPO
MPFKLLEVDPAADFDELIECDAREEALKASTKDQLEWHAADPTGYWQKVVNDGGKIVAGALWKIYTTNPFEKPDEHEEAYWYPEGGQRDYVTTALGMFDGPRGKMGRRPHIFLNVIFTHPDYRRQGAADLIMDWGIKKADDMGLEMWLNATVYGVPLYEKHGFVVVEENHVHPIKENPDEEWKKAEEALTPITVWAMWRPIGGKYEQGTPKPWE